MILKIDKPIRLIELFAGIGSQAKALKRLGANFEHYRICEFDKYAIASYNAVHGTNFETSDITQISANDLGIVDTDKYCYITTYSFPCQDLSLAGKGNGMAKGSGTRSGLLWEVERLLNECTELPQILLMENVTQVHGKKNKEHFDEWIAFLESKGYSNYWKDLNAKNFGIPQNRNRTFMISVLGDYIYEFPKEFPLELRLKDMLEDGVDEKFYISNEKVEKIVGNLPQINETAGGIVGEYATKLKKITDISGTLMARDYKGFGHQEMNCVIEPKVLGGIGEKKSNGGTHPAIKRVDIPQTVKVRKYEVDCKLLCETLRAYKQSSNLSNKEIAERLNVPVTKVEHWFRQDDCFAIPDPEIWFDLKTLLGIESLEFDESIMTFEEKEGVYEKSERHYLSDGIAPTLTSTSAGNEKIITSAAMRGRYNENGEVEQNIELSDREYANAITTVQKDSLVVEPVIVEDFYKNRDERVYEGIAPTLRGERIGLKVVEPQVLRAERTEYGKAIRKQYESGEIEEKIGNMREMKPRTDGIANTITTLLKDNYVAEPLINVVGNYSPSGHDASRIVTTDGLAPTVKENHGTVTAIVEPQERFFKQALETLEENDCSSGDTIDAFNKRVNRSGITPTITTRPEGFKTAILPVVEALAYDEQNGYIRKDGTVGTLTTDGSSPKHNNRVIVRVANKKGYDEAFEGDSINLEQPNSKTRRGRVGHGVAQTLNTAPQQAVVEPQIIRETPLEREGWHEYAKEVLSAQGLCRTLSTQSNNLATKVKEPCTLRIRKLTPKECWRLMGFDDADFDKAAKVNSNSQLYKQAGNSIVVNVLEEIFKQML